MVSVEAPSDRDSLMGKFSTWFGGEDSTGFILKMLSPVLFIFVVGILFPLVYGVYISFFTFPKRSVQVYVAFGNYVALFNDPEFWDSYVNTILFTVITVSLELVFGLAIALLLNKEFKGRGIVRAAILVPWAIPTIVNARIWEYVFGATLRSPVNDMMYRLGMIKDPLVFTSGRDVPVNVLEVLFTVAFIATFLASAYIVYINISNNGIHDLDFTRKELIILGTFVLSFIMTIIVPNKAYAASGLFGFTSMSMERDWIVIITVDVWKTTPFMALLILAGLQVIPQDLLKAAEVDGANAWQKFRNVTYPLLLPSMGVALLFRLIDAFRVYDIFAIFETDGIQSITKFAMDNHTRGRYGLSSSIAIFEFMNIIVMTVVVMTLTRRRTDQ